MASFKKQIFSVDATRISCSNCEIIYTDIDKRKIFLYDILTTNTSCVKKPFFYDLVLKDYVLHNSSEEKFIQKIKGNSSYACISHNEQGERIYLYKLIDEKNPLRYYTSIDDSVKVLKSSNSVYDLKSVFIENTFFMFYRAGFDNNKLVARDIATGKEYTISSNQIYGYDVVYDTKKHNLYICLSERDKGLIFLMLNSAFVLQKEIFLEHTRTSNICLCSCNNKTFIAYRTEKGEGACIKIT